MISASAPQVGHSPAKKFSLSPQVEITKDRTSLSEMLQEGRYIKMKIQILTKTSENMKLKSTVEKRNNVDPKGKGNLIEDGSIKNTDIRKQPSRPPVGRRQINVAGHKTRKVWKRKGSDERTMKNG